MAKGISDEVLFISDLRDWPADFLNVAADATSFPWVWDSVTGVAHVPSAASPAVPISSPIVESPVAPDGANDDVSGLIHEQSPDGDFSYHGPEAAQVSFDGESPAPTVITTDTAISVLPVAVHSAIGLAAAPMPDVVGIGYDGGVVAPAYAHDQAFFTSPQAAVYSALSAATMTGPQAPSSDDVTNASIGSHGATAAQVRQALNESASNANGAGIKVGVLSDSFNDLGGYASDQANGA